MAAIGYSSLYPHMSHNISAMNCQTPANTPTRNTQVSTSAPSRGFTYYLQLAHNALMHALNGNIVRADGYSVYLQAARNRAMHALNGNRNKGKTATLVVEKKAKPHKKKEAQTKKQPKLALVVAPKARVIRGHGDYELGKNIGGKVGTWLGGKIHSWVSSIFGSGDYTIASPNEGITSNSLLASNTTPQFDGARDGHVRFSFAEFLGYRKVTTGFSVNTFNLDVSSSATFPWSHPMARLYQQYIIHGMIFVVKSNMSQLTTAPSMGTIFGSVRYDVDSLPPTDKKEVMNSLFASSTRASDNSVYPLECKRKQTITWPMKVRQPGVTTGDEQFYSLGKFDLCTEGAPVEAEKGLEVTVVYDVEYLKPRQTMGAGVRSLFADILTGTNSSLLRFLPNTTQVTQPRVNTLGATVEEAGTIKLPYDVEPGTCYRVRLAYANPAANVLVMPGTYNFLTAMNFAYNQSSSLLMSGGATASAAFYNNITEIVIKVGPGATPANPPSFKFAYAGALVAISGNLWIDEVDPRVCSGLTAIPPHIMNRSEFVSALDDMDKGEAVDHGMDFNETRLIDYVEAFRRTPSVDITCVPRSLEAYDIGLREAIDRMAVFRTRPKDVDDDETKDYFFDEHESRGRNSRARARLNGNNGSYTNGDDVEDIQRWLGPMIPTTNITCDAEVSDDEYYEIQEAYVNGESNRDVVREAIDMLARHTKATLPTIRPPSEAPRHTLEALTYFNSVWVGKAATIDTLAEWPFRIYITDKPSLPRRPIDWEFVKPGKAPQLHLPGSWLLRGIRKRRFCVTGTTMRTLLCMARTGKDCDHSFWHCYGTFILLCELTMSLARRRKALNGNNGSATNTDDVDHIIGMCGDKSCSRATHSHPKHDPNKTPNPNTIAKQSENQKNASRRIAQKNLQLCTDEKGAPNPLVEGRCPLGPHYHKRKQKGASDAEVLQNPNEHSTAKIMAALGRLGPSIISNTAAMGVCDIAAMGLGNLMCPNDSDGDDDEPPPPTPAPPTPSLSTTPLSVTSEQTIYHASEVKTQATQNGTGNQTQEHKVFNRTPGPAIAQPTTPRLGRCAASRLLPDYHPGSAARAQFPPVVVQRGNTSSSTTNAGSTPSPWQRITENRTSRAQVNTAIPPPNDQRRSFVTRGAPTSQPAPTAAQAQDASSSRGNSSPAPTAEPDQVPRPPPNLRARTAAPGVEPPRGSPPHRPPPPARPQQQPAQQTPNPPPRPPPPAEPRQQPAQQPPNRPFPPPPAPPADGQGQGPAPPPGNPGPAPPPGGPGPGAVQDQAQAPAPAVPQDPALMEYDLDDEVFANMRNRAQTMWLTYDATNPNNADNVIRALTLIARNAKLYKRYPDIDERIVMINENALRRITDLRIAAASERAVQYGGSMFRRLFVWAHQEWRRHLFYTRIDELKYRERVTMGSRVVPTIAELAIGGAVVCCAMGLTYLVLTKAAAKTERMVETTAGKMLQSVYYLQKQSSAVPKALINSITRNTMAAVCNTDDSIQPEVRPLSTYKSIFQFLKYGWFMMAYSVYGAPVLEENVKRYVGRFKYFDDKPVMRKVCDVTCGLAFGALENVTNGPLYGRVWGRYALHGALATLPLNHAIYFHSLWNAVACYTGILNQIEAIEPIPPFSVSVVTMHVSALLAPLVARQTYMHSISHQHMCIEDICLDGLVPLVPTQPAFRYTPGELNCIQKHGCSGYWGIYGRVGTVFRMCSHNEAIALHGRVGKLLPVHVNPEVYQAMVERWRVEVLPFMNILRHLQVPKQHAPMNFELWASTFPPSRREALLRIGRYATDFNLAASAFIKREVAVKDMDDVKFKDPRWIQGCPLELSCSVGPYLRPWVKSVRDVFMPNWLPTSWNNCNQIVYTCGLNAVEVGDCLQKAIDTVTETMDYGDNVIFVEDDQSRFDLHLTEGAFHMLDRIYSTYLPRKVRRLLKRRTSRGYSKLGGRYAVPYTMQSGWPDTSIGDTLINICMKYAAHGRGNNWISIVCGDDSVTITTERELNRRGGIDGLRRVYEGFGMEIEIMVRDDVLDVEFCSGRFYPTCGSFVLMPRIGRILSKVCWDLEQRSPAQRIEWLRSIASTMENYGLVDPLCCALAKMLRRYVGAGKGMHTESEYKYYVGNTLLNRPTETDKATYYSHHYDLCHTALYDIARVIENSQLGEYCCDVRLQAIAAKDCT